MRDFDKVGGGEDVGEDVCCSEDGGEIQQGPVHCFNFFLSFEVLRPEHLTWSQPLQVVHKIAMLFV